MARATTTSCADRQITSAKVPTVPLAKPATTMASACLFRAPNRDKPAAPARHAVEISSVTKYPVPARRSRSVALKVKSVVELTTVAKGFAATARASQISCAARQSRLPRVMNALRGNCAPSSGHARTSPAPGIPRRVEGYRNAVKGSFAMTKQEPVCTPMNSNPRPRRQLPLLQVRPSVQQPTRTSPHRRPYLQRPPAPLLLRAARFRSCRLTVLGSVSLACSPQA